MEKPSAPTQQKPSHPTPSQPTTNAPDPDDGYSDTRSGGPLQEGRGSLYERIEQLVRSNPEFEVSYYEEK